MPVRTTVSSSASIVLTAFASMERVGLLTWTACRFVMHCTTETKKPTFSARQQSRSAIREKYMHNADGSVRTQRRKGFEPPHSRIWRLPSPSCLRDKQNYYFMCKIIALQKTCFIWHGFAGYQTEQEPLRAVIHNTCPILLSAWGPEVWAYHYMRVPAIQTAFVF